MYYVLPCRESLDDFIFVTVQGVGIGEGCFCGCFGGSGPTNMILNIDCSPVSP